jgi:hypothetical protein
VSTVFSSFWPAGSQIEPQAMRLAERKPRLAFWRRFEQPAGQVPVAMHGAPQYHLTAENFRKQHVPSERTKHRKASPGPQSWVNKSPERSEFGLLDR